MGSHKLSNTEEVELVASLSIPPQQVGGCLLGLGWVWAGAQGSWAHQAVRHTSVGLAAPAPAVVLQPSPATPPLLSLLLLLLLFSSGLYF